MTLYIKEYQKYERSKLKHLDVLSKSSLKICQDDDMKNANLLHKWGFGDSQSNSTVSLILMEERDKLRFKPGLPIFKPTHHNGHINRI